MSQCEVTVLNNGVTFSAPYDECILDAGLAAGVALPHQCRGASCGQCKAHIESGSVDHGWSFGFAITDEEKDQGYCLMCQAHPTSSALTLRTVQPFGDEAVAPLTECEGVVVALDQLNARVRRVVVHAEGAASLFRAGSYVELQLPGIAPDRMYSFANAGGGDDQFEFLISRHPDGLATTYLHETIALGQRVRMKGPFGTCHLPQGDGPVLGLAGGTGLAPVISIFEAALQGGATDAFTLLFGVRSDADIFEMSRLLKLARQFPNFAFELVVAQGPSKFCERPGLINDHIAARYESLAGWRAVISGAPGFVDVCTKSCSDLGIEAAAISADSFTTLPLLSIE